VLWEDHSDAFKVFITQWIFARGALPDAWEAAGARLGRAGRPGYGLLVARRPGARPGGV
jgi:hypothetical protein